MCLSTLPKSFTSTETCKLLRGNRDLKGRALMYSTVLNIRNKRLLGISAA
jgi:hypothetical protein